MKKTTLKFLLLALLPLIPLMNVTNASYFDVENSPVNSFKASELDLELRNENEKVIEGPLFDEKKLRKEESISKKIKVVNEGNINFYYRPEFAFTNDNLNVCEELTLKASKDGVHVFEGNLSDLATSSAQITGSEDLWEFEILHDSNEESLQGEKCRFGIQFDAYQNINQSGFSDSEILNNKIGFAYEPILSVYHNKVTHKFIFTLSKLTNFTDFEYELTYDTDSISDGVNGSEDLNGEANKVIEVDLGTVSDGVLTPHINPHNFKLDILLTDIDGDSIDLSETL